ncbi:MAG: quinone oxidoreductase [Proteobacteria bacterium]|nr:quinone oxidoreductase [Pseudomonadota bacterium]
MNKVVIFKEAGEPKVLHLHEMPMPEPKAGQVLVRQTRIGVNFIDVQMRKGTYPVHNFPCIPGFEACGVVEKLGKDVTGLRVGDRVAYATSPEPGAYQHYRAIDRKYLLNVPNNLEDKVVAATLLKGLTAHYLLRRVFVVRKGHAVLIHAAAGALGQIMARWANLEGALVIGTVGSDEKKHIAERAGCHFVVNYSQSHWHEQVLEFTKGIGVNAVYDSIGHDTFRHSLQCLMPAGIMVSFGYASGMVEHVSINMLRERSLFLTTPKLFDYTSQRAALVLAADEVFDAIAKKIIVPHVHKVYHLSEAASAHADLESRKVNGSLVLTTH